MRLFLPFVITMVIIWCPLQLLNISIGYWLSDISSYQQVRKWTVSRKAVIVALPMMSALTKSYCKREWFLKIVLCSLSIFSRFFLADHGNFLFSPVPTLQVCFFLSQCTATSVWINSWTLLSTSLILGRLLTK